MPHLVRRSLVCAILLFAAAACDSSPTAPDQSDVAYAQTDLIVGTGAEATAGRTAAVAYAGWFYSPNAAENKGQQFDANQFSYLVGSTQVIRGFDQAVTGMRVGGVRRATIPPSLAYGSTGSNTIPPNAALVFEIQLLGLQ